MVGLSFLIFSFRLYKKAHITLHYMKTTNLENQVNIQNIKQLFIFRVLKNNESTRNNSSFRRPSIPSVIHFIPSVSLHSSRL